MRHMPPAVAAAYRPYPHRVYVAGPLFSSGQVDENVRRACYVGALLQVHGMQPFVPHINVLWAKHEKYVTESEWLAWDLGWLDMCHALVRLPGKSTGTEIEIAHCEARKIPVFALEGSLYEATVEAVVRIRGIAL